MPVSDAKEMILRTSAKELLKYRPSWLKDCVRIRKMKDGIKLHPEHGLNPSIEVCMICGEEMGIALLGNNIKGQAPHHICTGEICDNCKKIIDDGGCFIIEVEDGSDQKNPYRTGRYCAIKKEAAKKILGQEHSVVYMEKSAYSQIIP